MLPQQMSHNEHGMTRLLVYPSLAGERIDRFLAASTSLSRRQARQLINDGCVWRNQRSLRVLSRTLETGDVVDIAQAPEALGRTSGVDLPPITVLWEDDWLLVANKPSGMLSQPASTQREDELSFDQLVLLHLAAEQGRRPFLRLLHRLDRLTSGCLVFARNQQALQPLSAAWRQGTVLRLYLAVVRGAVPRPSFDIDVPLARDPGHHWRFRTSTGGKTALTRVRQLCSFGDDVSLLACTLTSGRTHQVRVHLAFMGIPVLGDRLYGGHPASSPRPLLHAAGLSLDHPQRGTPLVIHCLPGPEFSPYVPDDLEQRLFELLAAHLPCPQT